MSTAAIFDYIHIGQGLTGHTEENPCLLARDISNDPYWSTLSGYSHLSTTPVTPLETRQSEALLYKLYYTLSGVRCRSVEETLGAGGNIQIGEDRSFIGSPVEAQAQPLLRACGGVTTVGTSSGSSNIFRSIDMRPLRMYQGEISNPANFIGYGITTPNLDDTVIDSAFSIYEGFSGSGVFLNSFFDDREHRFHTLIDHDIVNLDGMSLVSRARINDDTFGIQSNQIVDATNLTASVSTNTFGTRSTLSFQITALDFYNLI